MSDWLHSRVIYSLLQRPVIHREWLKILQSQPHVNPYFAWNQHSTGRVDGYPENGADPQLQDLLEYFGSNDDAAALAQLAFRKVVHPSCPPPVPRKDYKDHHNATLQELMDDTESWNKFMSTIPEDDLLPTNVCDMEFSMAKNAFEQQYNDFMLD